MTLAPRWQKLIADMASIKGRLALVIAAMAMGLLATITITSAYTVLTREISANYLGTNPASGILDIGVVDDALVERVAAMPNVAAAEPLSIVETRVRYADESWGRALLFVSPDPLKQDISRLRAEQSIASRPPGTIFLERRALDLAKIEIGDSLTFEIPGAGLVSAPVGGTVFDPSLAPAAQEQTAYIYLDQASFIALGGAPSLEMIRVQIADMPLDQTRVDETLTLIASTLRADGVNVHMVQVPNAGMHPHEGQMRGILAMFLLFGILAFLLSAVLVSVTVEGLMAQQMRQIAIMKTIGGRTGQIAWLYIVGMLVLGAATLVLALPAGLLLGNQLADMVARLLNFDLFDRSLPYWLFAIWIASGLVIPVLFALRPILKAAGATITSALGDLSISRGGAFSGRTSRLFGAMFITSGVTLLSVRGVLRRGGRTALILMLLAMAGGVFMAARNVANSYQTSIDIASEERHYDAEIRLAKPLPADWLVQIAQADMKVVSALPMLRLEAANAREDGLALVRTYPDGGHGSLTLYAFEDPANLRQHHVLAGVLPSSSLQGTLVVNQSAWGLLGSPEIGDIVRLSIDGNLLTLPLVAIVRQYMTPATVFAAPSDIANATGETGANTLRIITKKGAVAAASTNIESQIEETDSSVALVISENLMAEAVSGHVAILITLLFLLGLLMAGVGFLGLTAAQGISVIERTREFGIIRAIGGLRGQIIGSILTEGLAIAVISIPLAILISLPLSYAVNTILGRMTFGMPLPFTFDVLSMGQWIAVAILGAALASLPPAINASRLSVRETLIQQ